jgi:hypothetical protein
MIFLTELTNKDDNSGKSNVVNTLYEEALNKGFLLRTSLCSAAIVIISYGL